MIKNLCMAAVAVSLLCACGGQKQQEKAEATETKTATKTTLSGLNPDNFVGQVDGKPVALYVLKNANGLEACITNWGGRWVSMMVPDKDGKMKDVILGYDKLSDYTASKGNYGALIGRYGNRIANGKFKLDGVEYTLPQNNKTNCLHGGPNGYHRQVWEAKQLSANAVQLTYLSKDGEAGFPGNLNLKVVYSLSDDNAMHINYEATTDKKTVVNMTNHCYFNLSGKLGTTILDHQLYVNADKYTPTDELAIPKFEAPVDGTPMDLRKPIVVGDHIDDNFDQLKIGGGYDHNWVLNTKCDVNKLAATVVAPTSGIKMDVYTNEPALQVYCGNAMPGTDKGKFGVTYPRRGAICLESQHYPDSPNHPEFPSTVLEPGKTYHSECVYKFSVK